MNYICFHTSGSLTSSTKRWGCWILAFLFLESHHFLYTSWHHTGLASLITTTRCSKLLYTRRTQRRGSFLCWRACPPLFKCEPYLTPALHCVSSHPSCYPFYAFFFSSWSFSTLILPFGVYNTQLCCQVAVETVKLTCWWIGGWLIVDQAACALVCLRACFMQMGSLPSACLQFRAVSSILCTAVTWV